MKITGLIAEYNPFHNGHQYHMEQAKKCTGADAILVVMSGDFVQRGAPAIMPKHLRAQMALESGASVVLELPVCFSTASAEKFAYGAVALLNQLGCVDSLCFGSECGDVTVLNNLAEILRKEPAKYKLALSEYLRQGDVFPLARQKAVADYLDSNVADPVLAEPNNILGIEYLKALQRLVSPISPCTIERISSHYHDTRLRETYSSATAIREKMQCAELNWDTLKEQMPKAAVKVMKEHDQVCFPIVSNDFSLLLKYKLLTETRETLVGYEDVSEELANRILNHLNRYESYEQFCDCLKTKEVTHSRVRRALLHILLGIKKSSSSTPLYARILGFRKDASDVLSAIKKYSELPLLTKLTATEELSLEARKMLDSDIFASNLYASLISDKFHTPFVHELEKQIVRV